MTDKLRCLETFLTEAAEADPMGGGVLPVRSILSYLDVPTQPPPLSPARAPPQGLFEFDQTGGFDPTDPEPIPELEFDQSLPD